LKLAVSRSRPSVSYGANFYFIAMTAVCEVVYKMTLYQNMLTYVDISLLIYYF